MQIVLPGALPEQAQVRELYKHLSSAAPTLAGWLSRGRASVSAAPVAEARCTAFEQWLLREQGFAPRSGQSMASGLGPLWLQSASVPDTEAIWLAELVHIAPSRDGAVLIPAAQLDITDAQSAQLLESAVHLFEGTGFSVSAHTSQRWRITPPAGFSPPFPSPELVAITSVNDWWMQQDEARSWRKLFNELQMSWFSHPVNDERMQHGLHPINGLWLFGGASRQQFTSPRDNTCLVYDDLYEYIIKQDWGGWLAALTQLEQTVFAPAAPSMPERIVLTGRERIVEITPDKRWWRRFFKSSSNDWSAW